MRNAKRNMKNIGRIMLRKQPITYSADTSQLNLIQRSTKSVIRSIENMGNRTQKALSKLNDFQKQSVKHDLKILDNKKKEFKKPKKEMVR